MIILNCKYNYYILSTNVYYERGLMKAIVEVIKSIAQLPKERLLEMYLEMKDVLIHNQEKLKNTQAGKSTIDAIIKRYDELDG